MVDSQRFKPGDVIVRKGCKYPEGALQVYEHTDTILRANPIGGGPVYAFPPEKQIELGFTVATEADIKAAHQWRAGRFYLDESPIFNGYHVGTRWNGWACPSFEKSEGLRIIAYLKGSNDVAEYREADDSFFIKFENADPDDPGETSTGHDVTLPDGRTVRLYGIGDGFTWSELQTPTNCEACESVLNPDLTCSTCGISHAGEPCDKCHRFGAHADDCDAAPTHDTEGGPKHVAPEDRVEPDKAARLKWEEERLALVDVFNKAYQYYMGWGFEYMYPGCFSYYQMGGDLTVCFTPDWSDKGVVDVQVQSGDGECFEGAGGDHPFASDRSAPALFRIVKPYLDRLAGKSAADLKRGETC